MSNPPNLDNFEMDLFRKGYELIAETELEEETDPLNHHRIFPNIESLCDDIRFAGFHEEILIRIKNRDNKYFAAVYIKD